MRKGRFSDSFFGLSERKGEKVVHRVETLDQMVELEYLVLRMFFDANEILERELYDDRLNRDR